MDDYTKEYVDPHDGLNGYFLSQKYGYKLLQLSEDNLSFRPDTIWVDTYTVAACPAHCVTKDDYQQSTIELCHSNGIYA